VVVSNLFDGFDHYNISNGRHLANLPTLIIDNVPLPSLFIKGSQSIDIVWKLLWIHLDIFWKFE
jgi:hypothetical protein